jgi:dihydroorotate dehydrogenase electron transfer subunit
LIENRPLSGGSHLLRIAFEGARRTSPVARPGQFVQMLPVHSVHLVRRPMSIHDEGDGWRSFMVKPVGPASREIVSLAPGDELDVSPPLGNGFVAAQKLAGARLLLVGGGFGIAPLHFLARQLDALPQGATYTMLYGGRTARDVEIEVLDGVQGEVLPSTEDGTLGFRGTCVDLAAKIVREAGEAARELAVLSCGSHGMMAALHAALEGRVSRIDVSLEEVMACGVGVCMGCVVRTTRGYVPICTEGPVFASREVFGLEAAHVGH